MLLADFDEAALVSVRPGTTGAGPRPLVAATKLGLIP